MTAGGSCSGEPLVDAIASFLAHARAAPLAGVRQPLERTIDEAGPDAIAFLGRPADRARRPQGLHQPRAQVFQPVLPRSAQMQPLLPGCARYLEAPGVWVLPIGLTGSERLFPAGEAALNQTPLTLNIGRPLPASQLREHAAGDRQRMMDNVGVAVAALLPSSYRGVYADRQGVGY